jgi:hypothetical protein
MIFVSQISDWQGFREDMRHQFLQEVEQSTFLKLSFRRICIACQVVDLHQRCRDPDRASCPV